MKTAIVVKRKGYTEKFDERKVYGSVYAACSSAHHTERQCEQIAASVTSAVKKWAKAKRRIRSTAIHKKVAGELKKKDKELEFFYEHHLPNLKKL